MCLSVFLQLFFLFCIYTVPYSSNEYVMRVIITDLGWYVIPSSPSLLPSYAVF